MTQARSEHVGIAVGQVIWSSPAGHRPHAIATEDTAWITSKAWLSTSLSSLANQALPAAPQAAAVRPAPSTHVDRGPSGLLPVRMGVHAAHSGSAPCPPGATGPGAPPLRTGARIRIARSDQPNDRSCR